MFDEIWFPEEINLTFRSSSFPTGTKGSASEYRCESRQEKRKQQIYCQLYQGLDVDVELDDGRAFTVELQAFREHVVNRKKAKINNRYTWEEEGKHLEKDMCSWVNAKQTLYLCHFSRRFSHEAQISFLAVFAFLILDFMWKTTRSSHERQFRNIHEDFVLM